MSTQKCSRWLVLTPETTPSYRYFYRLVSGCQSWRICELRISILSSPPLLFEEKGVSSGRLPLKKKASMPSKAIWQSEVRVSHAESFSTTRVSQFKSRGYEHLL